MRAPTDGIQSENTPGPTFPGPTERADLLKRKLNDMGQEHVENTAKIDQQSQQDEAHVAQLHAGVAQADADDYALKTKAAKLRAEHCLYVQNSSVAHSMLCREEAFEAWRLAALHERQQRLLSPLTPQPHHRTTTS